MDPLFRQRFDLNLQVPCLVKTPYNHGENWFEFPDRHGVSLSHIRFEQYHRYEPSHLASTLQNWLFFGLMDAILPFKIQKEDFINSDDRGTTLSTAFLPKYLRDWALFYTKVPLDQRQVAYRRNIKILTEARTLVFMLSDFPESGSLHINLFPPLPRIVGLSCAAIGETISIANKAIFESDAIPGFGNQSVWSTGSLLLEYMQIQGWCPFILANLELEGSLSLKHYLATIGRPLAIRNHRKCADHICRAHEFLPEEVQHINPDCDCLLEELPMNDLAELILGEHTPLIKFVFDSEESVRGARIVLGKVDKSTRYVAISHVWADGLGNPESNSMPRCQLKRVQQAVDSLYSPSNTQTPNLEATSTWFWMDTLCVPNGRKHKKLNKKALPHMKRIYLEADKVLVIDSEVVAIQNPTNSHEILSRVRLSNWLRRLWTLQEGYFAQSLHFLVDKTTVSLAQILQDVCDTKQQPPMDALWSSMWQGVVRNFRALFTRALDESGHPFAEEPKFDENGIPFVGHELDARPTEGTVSKILRAVFSRTSKFLDDEAGCLAFLLNLDKELLSSVLNAPSNRKMMSLFKGLDSSGNYLVPKGCIPPGILLLPGKRINIDGFKWAPASFIASPNQNDLVSHAFKVPEDYPGINTMTRPSGMLCKHGNGLRVMFPGLQLDIREEHLVEIHFVVDASDDTALDSSEETKGKPPSIWRATYSKDEHDEPWEKICPKKSDSGTIAIIIFEYDFASSNETKVGALVRISGKCEDGALAVSRVCKMVIARTPEYDSFDWMQLPSKRVTGKWLPVHQMWCVD